MTAASPQVETELHLRELVEAQHNLLESVFPRHIIEVMAICNPATNSRAEGLLRPRSMNELRRLATWHPQVINTK